MVLSEWLEEKNMSLQERLDYLKKYDPPARWYVWMIHFLWKVEDVAIEENEHLPYFIKLEELGFNKTNAFDIDFNREDLI